MRRIGILTAGGDTPALNTTIFGAVERANAKRVEVYGIIDGFAGLLDPRVPHVELNPHLTTIPELDPWRGGTLLGASRTYLDPASTEIANRVAERLARLGIEGLVCVGGDGTANAIRSLFDRFPCVLAPKTIDNDLGLNYFDEASEWIGANPDGSRAPSARHVRHREIALEDIVNYVTPGYATAVYVVAQGIQRIRTTAEGHRRIAIVEVMGRHAGYIALGSAYGQPDLILLPEVPLDLPLLEDRVRQLYELQKHAVIVVGEAIVDADGRPLGGMSKSVDPAGNIAFSGAADQLKAILARSLGNRYFLSNNYDKAEAAIFTRKVGHTQRGGRPIFFDRFHAAQLGGHAVDLLLDGQYSAMATLQWSERKGFHLDSIPTCKLRDPFGTIHPRQVHPSLFESQRLRPSILGVQYLRRIFDHALRADDFDQLHTSIFRSTQLTVPYHSVNVEIEKRIRRLDTDAAAANY